MASAINVAKAGENLAAAASRKWQYQRNINGPAA
jgi:hypothetical protein